MATYYTAASADDGHEVISTGVNSITLTGTTSAARIDGANHAGFRFPSISAARGVGVVSAVLKFPQLAGYTGGSATLTNVKLYGHNIANSAVFSTAGSNISARPRTNAYIEGSTLGATSTQFTTNGVDVTRIVQEIIDRPDWAAGNALSLLFIGNGTAGNYIQPYTYDYSSAIYKAELQITLATGLETNLYYFDGSDAAVTDPNSVYTNDANLTDGNTATGATASVNGSVSSNYLKVEGTNAPSSGNSIYSVGVKIYGSNPSAGVYAAVYTDGLGQLLGTGNNFGTYTTLTAPTGGWTWAKLQALEVKAYGAGIGTSPTLSHVELQVLSIGTGGDVLPPTTVTVDTSSGTGAWTNPQNVDNLDSTAATATISGSGQISYILKTSDYGFNIPPTANINGIVVDVRRRGTAAKDSLAQIMKAGVPVGFDHSKTTNWAASYEGIGYGSSDDQWGVNWTAAEINNSGFGFAYQVANTSGGGTAEVDSITITVYYNNPTKGYYELKQSYQVTPNNPAMLTGNQAINTQNGLQAVTNNSGSTINLTRMTFRLGAAHSSRVGNALKVRLFTSLSDATNNTNVVKTWNGTLKNTIIEDYDYYFDTPQSWSNGATLYFLFQSTGTSGAGDPDFIQYAGRNYFGFSDDDSNQAVSKQPLDGSATITAQPVSIFYEAYEAQDVIPAESAYPVGDSDMTVSGYAVTYGSASPSADSIVTAAGLMMGYGSASMVGDAKMIADRIIMLGNSVMTANGSVVPLTITKTYMYKIYDQDWNYLGAWNDVVSEFGYSQEINTAGSAINVVLARNSDSLVSQYDSIGNDSGVAVVTDDNSEIAAEIKTENAIGPGTTVDLNLNVKIYEYSNITEDIEGDLVFTGYISQYTSQYGSNETTTISIFSYGADLDNWVLNVSENTRVPYLSYDPAEILRDSLDKFQAAGGLIGYGGGTPGVKTTTRNMIPNPSFEVNTTGWTIGFSGTGQSLTRVTTEHDSGVAALQVNSGTSNNGAAVILVGLVVGQQYTIQAKMKATAGSSLYININGVSGVATTFTTATGGWDLVSRTFTSTVVNGNISMGRNGASTTCYIDSVMLSEGASVPTYFDGSFTDDATTTYSWTGVSHNSQSTKLIDIDPVGTSIDNTDTISTYTFNMNTELEVIKKSLELAPTDWFFYTDLATNYLHFHARPTVPNHYFYLGKHIVNFNLERTIEGLINDVYFTGGVPTNQVLNKYYGIAGTPLDSYTGEIGGAWVLHPNSTVGHRAVITDVNRLRGDGAFEGVYYNSTVLASTDYTVEADFTVKSLTGNQGLIGRVDSSALTYYLVNFDPTTQAMSLYKCIAGTFTQLQTVTLPAANTLVVGNTYHVELKMEGAQISATINNQKYLDIEDRSIIAGSYAGVRLVSADSNTTGLHIDNYQVQLIDNSMATPIYKRYTDNTSVALYRRGLERISDNRVTLEDSADLIVASRINRANTPRYQSTITISNGSYEIKTIKLGDLVGFRNFGNYVDDVTMQIVRIDYSPDAVTLQLDTVSPSVPKRLEDIKRNLNQADVADNPDTPTT